MVPTASSWRVSCCSSVRSRSMTTQPRSSRRCSALRALATRTRPPARNSTASPSAASARVRAFSWPGTGAASQGVPARSGWPSSRCAAALKTLIRPSAETPITPSSTPCSTATWSWTRVLISSGSRPRVSRWSRRRSRKEARTPASRAPAAVRAIGHDVPGQALADGFGGIAHAHLTHHRGRIRREHRDLGAGGRTQRARVPGGDFLAGQRLGGVGADPLAQPLGVGVGQPDAGLVRDDHKQGPGAGAGALGGGHQRTGQQFGRPGECPGAR